MRKQKGYTIIEFLIVIAIVGTIALIVIPRLLRARVDSVVSLFKTHFGVDLSGSIDKLGEPPDQWLTAKQKAVLRPYVQKRLSELCTTPRTPAEDPAPALDPGAVQLRLQEASREGATAQSMAKACSEAATAARALGILPAEAP